MSFVTDIIDNGVCPGFWINKKNGKVHSPGLQSPNIGDATLSQNVLGIHDDTHSYGFSSEVIWIFCTHRNKKLKQLSLPINSKLNSSLLLFTAVTSSNYESIPTSFVTRTLLFTDFCRAAIVQSSVVQLLLTCRPFYKNATTRGPLLIKWCIKNNLTRWKKENRWVESVCHWNYYTIAIKFITNQCNACGWCFSDTIVPISIPMLVVASRRLSSSVLTDIRFMFWIWLAS